MNKINTRLLKKFIEESHNSCKFCNLKGTICVGKNCTEEIFKSLLVKNNSELKNVREWVKNNPNYSISYRLDDLNDYERAYCIKKSPHYAVRHMFEKMSEEEKELCIKEEPYWVLKWYLNKLTEKQYKLCQKLLKEKSRQ